MNECCMRVDRFGYVFGDGGKTNCHARTVREV